MHGISRFVNIFHKLWFRLNIQFISFIGVYDFGSMVFKFPLDVCAIVHMNMAVDQALGMIMIDQFQKAFKTTMGIIIPVTIAGRRCMSQYNINTACLFQLPPQSANPSAHCPFRILVLSTVILGASAKAKNPKAFMHIDPAFDAIASFWWPLPIGNIVVAVNVEKRGPPHGHKKGQIARFQVAAGKNQVVGIKSAGLIILCGSEPNLQQKPELWHPE